MTNDEAKTIVASILAYNTAEHIRAANEIPNLRQNTVDAGNRNREVAEALDILPEYWGKLAIHAPVKE